MDLVTSTSLIGTVLLSVYLYIKWALSYWRRQGLVYQEANLFDKIGEQFIEAYKKFKPKGIKHCGTFVLLKPVYVPFDLDIIKCIMIQDFSNFTNIGRYCNEQADPLSGHLFNLTDDNWRKMRTQLNPTFSSKKIKPMFQILEGITIDLIDVFKGHAVMQDPVDIKEIVGRCTMNNIGSCVFGLDCNSIKNPDDDFTRHVKKFFELFPTNELISLMVPHFILHKFNVSLTPKNIENFFLNLVKDTVRYREENNVQRKDFVYLLMKLRNREGAENTEKDIENHTNSENVVTLNQMAAQCYVFFLAGYETAANTISFTLLELAQNQEIQNKLRQEIKEKLRENGGKMSYDCLMSMEYLDKVLQESLRKNPSVKYINRICDKEYQVPGTEFVLKDGTMIALPIHAIHNDPEYYPYPEKFDPERFTSENKAKRHPLAFLPFGDGPRMCIGRKFAILQVKIALYAILNNFKVSLNKKTKLPIELSPGIISSTKHPIWLNVENIK